MQFSCRFDPRGPCSQHGPHESPLCPTLTHFPPPAPHSAVFSGPYFLFTQYRRHVSGGASTRRKKLFRTPAVTSVSPEHSRRTQTAGLRQASAGQAAPWGEVGEIRGGRWGTLRACKNPPGPIYHRSRAGSLRLLEGATGGPRSAGGSSLPSPRFAGSAGAAPARRCERSTQAGQARGAP